MSTILLGFLFFSVCKIACTQTLDKSGSGDTAFPIAAAGGMGTSSRQMGGQLIISTPQNPAPLGEDVTLRCGDGATDEFDATWQFNGMLLRAESGIAMTGTLLTISRFQAQQSGAYSCLHNDQLSPDFVLEYTISKPEIQVAMIVPVLLGDDFMLICVTQALSVTYTWYRNKVALAEKGSLLIGEMSPKDAGHYACSVEERIVQSETSDEVNIDFKVPRPNVEPDNANFVGTTFPIGMDVRLECVSLLNMPIVIPKVLWFKDNAMIDDRDARYKMDDHALRIMDFGQADAGGIRCLEEVDGRQSEKSENLDITYSEPEIIINIDGSQYNSTTSLGPIALGSGVHMECVSDITYSVPIERVDWFIEKSDVIQTTSLDFVMHPYYVTNVSCQFVYGANFGSSAQSPRIELTYKVPIPQVLSSSSKSVFYIGERVDLKCQTQYDPQPPPTMELSYQWFYNGQQLRNDPPFAMQESTLTIMSFHEEMAGPYSCIEDINQVTSERSDDYTISAAVPTPAALLSTDTTTTLGNRVELRCLSSLSNGDRNSKMVWFHNGKEVDLSVATSALVEDEKYLITNYQVTDMGSYQCAEEIDVTRSEKSNEIFLNATVPAPTVAILNGTTFLLGSTITLICYNPAVSMGTITSSQWFKNSGALSTNSDARMHVDTASLTIQNYAHTDVADYSCVNVVDNVSSAMSGVYSTTIAVPQPSISTASTTVSIGGTVTLECLSAVSASLARNADIRWHKDWAPITADSNYIMDVNNTLKVQNARTEHAGVYQCEEVYAAVHSPFSEASNLDVFVPVPEIRPERSEVSAVLGSSFKLFCGSKVPMDNVQWRRDNATFSWDGLNLTKVMEVEDRGVYTCRVGVVNLWSEWSSGRTLTFEVPAPVIIPEDGEVSPMLGEKFQLSCHALEEPTEIEWMRKNKTLPNHQIIFAEEMAVDLAGNYTCRAFLYGLWSFWSAELEVSFQFPKPTISTNETEVFLGDPVRMTCVSGYTNADVTDRVYKWTAHRKEMDPSDIVATDNVLLIPTMSRDIKKNIRCKEVIANIRSKESKKIELTYLVPRPILSAPAFPVVFDQDVDLRCRRGYDHHEPSSKIWWYKGNETIVGSNISVEINDSFLHIENFNFGHEGPYHCVDKVRITFSEMSEVVSLSAPVPLPVVAVSSGEETVKTSLFVTLGTQFRIECHTELSVDADFFWMKNGEILSSEQSNILRQGVMSLQDAGPYKCMIFLPFLSRESEWSHELVIDYSVPLPTLHSNTTRPIIGDPLYLKCVSGYRRDHNSSFVWYRDGETLDDETADVLTIWVIVPSHGGIYKCQETIGHKNSAKSPEVQIRYEVPAPILESATTVKAGESVTLTCSSRVFLATAEFQSEFIWSFGSDQLYGYNSSVLELNNFHPNWTGPFQCQETTGSVTSEWSNELYIRFQDTSPVGPVIISTTQPTVPEKSAIRLMCELGGDDNSSLTSRAYYWYQDENLLEGLKDNVLSIKSFTSRHDGNYSCGVRMHDGSVMRSLSISLRTVDAHALCSCPCGNATKNLVLNQTEMEEMVTSIQKNLSMDSGSLSSAVRSKTSAPDSRPASISVGSVAVCFLVFVPSIVVTFDCINLLWYLKDRMQYRT